MARVRGRIDYPKEPTSPVFHIPLSDDELRTIGELCAIQGQIEFFMQLTVKVLLKISMPNARKRLGRPNITANANVWLTAVEKHVPREEIKELARLVVEEIEVIRRGRNDFVHAVFAISGEKEGDFWMQRNIVGEIPPLGYKPAVAVHNLKTKPMENLKETRDKAAAISRFIFHIYENNGTIIPPGVSQV